MGDEQEKAADKLKRGRRLGKYRLSECLGIGGSSEVWKARDTIEGIWVALKIPQIGSTGQRNSNALLKEIRQLAQLRHAHIMPVKNADMIDGHAVLATEISSGTLEDRSRGMSPRNIIFIIEQVLRGLSYAHRHRVVHCDVTPNNIFLFDDKRAALGDFGISLKIKGRMKTIDDFGTPGYVAPEQAYGYPTYRSDCFSIALILYEFITGVLPRWPFNWPFKGYDRLLQKTSMKFVKFIKMSLEVNPDKRFPNAGKMLVALQEATPRSLKNGHTDKNEKPMINWQQARRQAFSKRYQRTLGQLLKCRHCGEPIAESMEICPWCGCGKNRFDSTTSLTHVCHRCHKGVLAEWKYCPWCYGEGFASPAEARTKGVRYSGQCKCGGKLMRFMRYCPWCHRKVRQNWDVHPFPEKCGKCNWPVDSAFWDYCPWCRQQLRD